MYPREGNPRKVITYLLLSDAIGVIILFCLLYSHFWRNR